MQKCKVLLTLLDKKEWKEEKKPTSAARSLKSLGVA